MILGYEAWIFWLILMIIFLVIEAATFNLTTIWFAVGCLAAIVLDLLNVHLIIQIIVMMLLSIALLAAYLLVLRPRLHAGGQGIAATNADRIIGKDAMVVETIDPVGGSGLIKALGQVWSAVSADGTTIEKGTMTVILEIQGVKAVVKPKETRAA